MNLKQLAALAARLRKDADLMAVIHISDEEALAIAKVLDKRPPPRERDHPASCLCRNCS